MKITRDMNLLDAYAGYENKRKMISNAIVNIYYEGNIHTVDRALRATSDEILRIEGVGKRGAKIFSEIQEYLRENLCVEPEAAESNREADQERLSVAKDILVAIINRDKQIDPDVAVNEAILFADKLIHKLSE